MTALNSGVNPRRHTAGDDDFFPTPPSATWAFFNACDEFLEDDPLRGLTWEPACGDGSMSKILEQYGLKTISSDLYDYGYGRTGVDFLDYSNPGRRKLAKKPFENIITNPPFRFMNGFLAAGLETSARRIAMFTPLRTLEGRGRYEHIFNHGLQPPTWIFVYVARCRLVYGKIDENGGSAIAFCWFLWDKKYPDQKFSKTVHIDNRRRNGRHLYDPAFNG